MFKFYKFLLTNLMSDNIPSETTEQLVERVRCDYDKEQLIDIELDIDEVLIQN